MYTKHSMLIIMKIMQIIRNLKFCIKHRCDNLHTQNFEMRKFIEYL